MNAKSFIYCAALALSSVFTPPASWAEMRHGARALFTMDNATAGNHVLAYGRAADGTLSFLGEFTTGGLGTGAGLGNQGALILSRSGGWLFACNAGSDEISVFKLRLTDCN